MSSGASVAASEWSYRYQGRADPALTGVTFAIRPGELVVLMGASGSGKSTLLSALAGTLPPSGASGLLTVAADGDVRIGLVQQEPDGNIVMEFVGDDIAFPLENVATPPDRIWPQVAAAAQSVGLDVPLQRRTDRLSGGQQQLLAVAAATVARPGLLLLDEPTANLDPDAAQRVLDAVEEVRRLTDCTVVVVEHRAQPWLERAARVLLVQHRSIVALEPDRVADYLRTRPELAARVWIEQRDPPHRPARRPLGDVVLEASGLTVPGRLAVTGLTARAGEVIALTGPPGTGKTTLLMCLGGLLAPGAGDVRVATADGWRAAPWRWPSQQVAAAFGTVFQNPEHQFVTGRVIDEVRHGLLVAGLDEDTSAQRASAMLQVLSLAHLGQADPFSLSGGEQRRLGVGTALVLDPRILLLDEPTFGQDPATWRQIVGIIADHSDAGGTVVMATHDPAVVAALDAKEVRLGPPPSGPAAQSEAEPPPRLRRLDPLALVGTAGLLSTAALLSASVALNLSAAAFGLIAALLGGLPARRVALLAGPAAVAAVSVGFSNALLSGQPLTSAAAWTAAALPASRVLAVAVPGLVAALALDPTAMADALVVRARVSPRSAYAVLAGLRLLPLLAQEWTVLGRASRSRGLGGAGARQRAREFGSMTFRLLVAALRRGQRLAIALDARGLRADAPRTVARPLRWDAADTLAVGVGACWMLAAVASRW